MREQPAVTLVTYEAMPELAPDDRRLRSALERLGVSVRTAIWSDEAVDWSLSPLTLIRSTWDYFDRIDQFRPWVARVASQTRLLNPPDVVLWNLDKRYLAQLAGSGVAVVPTRYLSRGAPFDLEAEAADLGASSVVLKPTISGAAKGAKRFNLATDAAEAVAHVRWLWSELGHDVMLQPFLDQVLAERERSLVFIGGAFSHAYLKPPFSAGAAGGVAGERTYSPQAHERTFAEGVLTTAGFDLAYARVDLVPSEHGPLLMELELIEPALKFELAEGSADSMAEWLIKTLQTAR